jgi:hypothetical protein
MFTQKKWEGGEIVLESIQYKKQNVEISTILQNQKLLWRKSKMNMNIKSPESIGIFPKVVENHESKSRTNFDELKSFIASLDPEQMAIFMDEIDSCEYCTEGKDTTGNSECTGNCMESILAWLKQAPYKTCGDCLFYVDKFGKCTNCLTPFGLIASGTKACERFVSKEYDDAPVQEDSEIRITVPADGIKTITSTVLESDADEK